MKPVPLKVCRLPLVLAAALATFVCASSSRAIVLIDDAASPGDSPADAVGITAARQPVRYIVRYTETPLAMYNAEQLARGLAPLPLKTTALGVRRLDVHSAAAQAYVSFLRDQQQAHVAAMSAALGRTVTPILSLQHALNASLLELTPSEAATVSNLPDVQQVVRERAYAPATDIGPGFIGAPGLWWNAPAAQDTLFAGGFDSGVGFFGDGVVVGDIDTGYNSLSPSFQPVDSKGYRVTNPLGSGNYLGQCSLPLISAAGCNDKVIGVYDEIDLTRSEGAFSAYSVEDRQGHGSHTASTAAGDYRSADFNGYVHDIAGVAPHANLVIYYACSPTVLCTDSATTAAVDHAIADGVVDVLNYSISGGRTPWDDPTSLAFLSAESAGIFVAAAAGNTSGGAAPQPGSVNHVEPWVATVAAGTHTGGSIAQVLNLIGPGPSTQTAVLTPSSGGDAPGRLAFDGALTLSPQFHNADTLGIDGCSGFAAGTFAGNIALLSRGGCTFSAKVNAAAAAGAVAVIISDNRVEGPLTLSVPGTNVPAFGVLQSEGTALNALLLSSPPNPNNLHVLAANIPDAASRHATQADVLASFSLLGPTYFDMVKPDLQAPGVSILAAVANDGSPQGADRVDVYNGTSMATPHTAGAGALLRQAQPHWTPAQIKSALMLSARENGLTQPDGKTASGFFDRGSGRIQVDAASKVGLVMDENTLDFALANPDAGGDPHALNVASLLSSDCAASCTFTRRVTSSSPNAVTWTASFAYPIGTITPSSFKLSAGASQALTMSINSAGLAPAATYPTEVLLLPDDATLSPLHMPVAYQVPAPKLQVMPTILNLGTVGSGPASANVTLKNTGGGSLAVTQGNSGNANYEWVHQTTRYMWGQSSTQYAARENGAAENFSAEDFTVTGFATANLSVIYTPGFAFPDSLASFGPQLPLHWRIYADVGGRPSGNPENSSAPVWSFDTTAANAGVAIGSARSPDDLQLNLAAAGAPPTALTPGHYWLVVYPTFACLGAGAGCTTGAWYWASSAAGSGGPPQTIELGTPTASGWSEIDPTIGKGLALQIASTVSCSVPSWLSQTGLPVTLGEKGTASTTVTATAPLGGAAATGYLCAATASPAMVTAVQVNALQ